MATVAPPLWVSPAYDDRDAVWQRVIAHPPYPIMAGTAGYEEMMSAFLPPWFRAHWALDGQADDEHAMALLDHEPFVAAAKQLFGAEVVRPATLLVNLMGPMPTGVRHVDTPTFRGLKRSAVPVWLLVCMGASGLFERWSVRVAGALTWFYDREDGEFEYWPPDRDESVVVRAPFGGDAFVSDNDLMAHRVGAIGDHESFAAALNRTSTLEWTGNERWLLRTDGAPIATLERADIRVSLLWKALTFLDAEDAARFDDHRDDLDMATIVATFGDDLAERGVVVEEPVDPFGDAQWIRALTGTYLQLPSA
jgi:hypothetical protein